MRINVILSKFGRKANDITAKHLQTEEALTAKGVALLREEMFDRKIINAKLFVTNSIMLPTETIKINESKINKVTSGIVTSFNISIDGNSANYSIKAEVI